MVETRNTSTVRTPDFGVTNAAEQQAPSPTINQESAAPPEQMEVDSAETGPSGTMTDKSPTPMPVDNEQQDEEEEYQRLVEQVKVKRRRDEMQALRDELAGNSQPTTTLELGNLPVRTKRPALDVGDGVPALPRYLRPATPPSYAAKSTREAAEYETGWKAYFGAVPAMPDTTKVLHAATYLKGNARDAWGRVDKPMETWDEYITWCRALIADPANRMAYASHQLMNIRQRHKQSVRELVNKIEELERDVPSQDERTRKAWQLLNCLEASTRREVLRENKEITSREQVIAAAQRHEELLASSKDQEPGEKQSTTGYRKFPSGKSPGNRVNSATVKQTEGKKEKPKGVVCYNCNKPGHLKKDCRSKPSSSQSGSKN